MGFNGPEAQLVSAFGVESTPQTNIKAVHGSNGDGFATSAPGIFAAGDCRRGQSLVVWAINEGQRAADAVNKYLLESRAFEAVRTVKDGVQSGRMGSRRGIHTSAFKPEDRKP
jgi:NADPH-dependent glutamate synthase beta subunit-like oxidoreductase